MSVLKAATQPSVNKSYLIQGLENNLAFYRSGGGNGSGNSDCLPSRRKAWKEIHCVYYVKHFPGVFKFLQDLVPHKAS